VEQGDVQIRCGGGAEQGGAWSKGGGAWRMEPAATARDVGSPAATVHGGGRARTWGRGRKKIEWSGAGQGPFCKFDRTDSGVYSATSA
jgi:hypothetical protein